MSEPRTPDEIRGQWITEVLASHPHEVARYREGNRGLFHFFVGAVMRLSGGRANPTKVVATLHERLDTKGVADS